MAELTTKEEARALHEANRERAEHRRAASRLIEAGIEVEEWALGYGVWQKGEPPPVEFVVALAAQMLGDGMARREFHPGLPKVLHDLAKRIEQEG